MDFGGPALPQTMRAVTMEGYGGPDTLTLRDVPLPPRRMDNDVLVEVHAAGVNPFETKLRRGFLHQLFPLSPNHVLGSDIAGTVAAVGFDVHQFQPGDRVWGLVDTLRSGGYAEYCAVNALLLRKMPENLSFEEAATVPMAGSTAWFGLVNLAQVQPGQRVLVHAGAGGVGAFGIQIAKHLGAWVATTCSAEKADFCRELGADQVIDYRAGDFRDAVRDIDVVLDPIGGETNLKSYEVMKPGGTLLVILRGDQVEMSNRERLMAEHGVNTKVVAFSAAPEILDLMKPLFEAGVLKAPLQTVLPLDQAAEAHRMMESGRTKGKVVLKVR
jgi:NADPH:quinone reductase-like Zn-dependent oxidoreductase